TYPPSDKDRTLELRLLHPGWAPTSMTTVTKLTGGRSDRPLTILPNQSVTFRESLSRAGGVFEFVGSPTFQPSAQGIGADTRVLGCMCQSCVILEDGQGHDLVARAA